jgi:hypothetical protein
VKLDSHWTSATVIRELRGDIHFILAGELREGWGVVVSLGSRLQFDLDT